MKNLIICLSMLLLFVLGCGIIEQSTDKYSAGNSSNSTAKPARTLTKNQRTIPEEINKLMPLELGRFTQIDGWKAPQVATAPERKGEQVEEYWALYSYIDKRFDKYRDEQAASSTTTRSDITINIYKFETPEKAVNYLKKVIYSGDFGKALPVENYPKMRLCNEAESENGAEDARPKIVTKTIQHPRGGVIQVMANGFHTAGKCQTDTRNSGGYAVWTDGIYAFVADSSGYYKKLPINFGETGPGLDIATDFAGDYVAALN